MMTSYYSKHANSQIEVGWINKIFRRKKMTKRQNKIFHKMQKRNWGDTHSKIRLIILLEKHVNCKLKQMKWLTIIIIFKIESHYTY